MGLALLALAAAAVSSGTAIVLQAVAARRLPDADRLDLSLVTGLARSRTYVVALALVALGFALSFVALRTLPLFAVQAGRASSLAVAAVGSALLLGARLGWRDWTGLAGIAIGLVALGTSVSTQTLPVLSTGTRGFVVAATVAIGLTAGVVALRPATPRRGLVLATVAGTAFGILAFGAHTVRVDSLATVVTDPVAWCAGLCGGLGLAVSALALRGAAVVAVTALMVGVETVTGAALGIAFAGDRPAVGAAGTAAVGFVLVLTGALVVARFASPGSVEPEPAPTAATV